MQKLPAFSIKDKVNDALKRHNTLVITAPPGAGKSTVLPLTILESMKDEGKILMLEPRRLAAKQIAERMAELLGEEVGQTVGYRVRFEKKISQSTRIEVLTEGILTRMLVNDPMLEGVSVVIFDEFHERSLNSDLALALTRETQGIVRPDLRIVIMSATIDSSGICEALKAPLIESEGRMYPVDIIYTQEEATPQNCALQVARIITKAHREHEGDILAFLPGQGEIAKCAELLGNSLGDTRVFPLYGLLSNKEQREAISPSPNGMRKVVLATPIAETSITIQGVRIVVDSGLCRTVFFDQRNSLSRLETVRISMDMATQRMGRAGRVASGVCYRLWTKATEHSMSDQRSAEITYADLAPMMLSVSAWGESEVTNLPWLTPPPSSNAFQAQHLLNLLGATDERGKITEQGKKMCAMPCHPRISRMLITADSDELKAIGCDIAALLEEKDPLADDLQNSDINTRISMLREARRKKKEGQWSRIIRIAKEYRRMVRVEEDNNMVDSSDVGLLIASAYPERIAQATDACGHYRLASGDNVFVAATDILSSHDWLAVATLNTNGGRIFLASPVSVDSLLHLAHRRENISWDSKQQCVVAQEEIRIGNLVLKNNPLHNVSRELIVESICKACVKEGTSMLNFSDDAVLSLQRRVECVAQWHPELSLPDLSTDAVLKCAEEWLPFYLDNNGKLRTSSSELHKIDLCQALWSLLSYEQQQEVERMAPLHITVPTGSKIRISYRQGTDVPILSVRLQECFGMTDTPKVNDGKIPVLMELLSPGFKPVQLTQDLGSFWTGTYFEVRKELRRRYPKHYWPDNPLEAEATRGVKRK